MLSCKTSWNIFKAFGALELEIICVARGDINFFKLPAKQPEEFDLLTSSSPLLCEISKLSSENSVSSQLDSLKVVSFCSSSGREPTF